MNEKSVTIRIPCSTSNLGSGFDTLGLALGLYNQISVRRMDSPVVQLAKPISERERDVLLPMVAEAADAFFSASGQKPFGMEVEMSGDVPAGRGFGASATARLGIIAALNAIAGFPLGRQQLLNLATSLEHHPDNVSPCLYGGFTVSGMVGEEVRCLAFPVSKELRFVTLVPRFQIDTAEARKLVPGTFSKADAAHSLNRAALISAAFSSGNYRALKGLFDDRVHQPYRERLIPELSAIIRAGERAGAIGGWLSGSGSAVMCVTLENPDRIGAAMQHELKNSDMLVLSADNKGMEIIDQ
ncbi:MAG TPA: homoserine kinase [Candidatus Saccharimonadales bacterium]|nr:homoserine kinase [Candidatus Saccharimonadales bacterium]